jgi:hypothetical protein
MNRNVAIVLVVLIVGAIFAMIVPMWVATADMGLPAAGWGAVVGTVIFCFGIGGGLMFLIFYSARHGYDEGGQAHADRNQAPSKPASKKA